MEKINFIYYKDEGFVIADLDFCEKSERTFDIRFNELANNENLLQKLNLVSMYCNSKDGTKWFANYLSAFNTQNGMYEKLKQNPLLRILVLNDALLSEVKLILGK